MYDISQEQFDEIQEKYQNLFVIIRHKQVIYADRSAKVVAEYAKKFLKEKNWYITKIDSGDAAFY